MQQEYHEYASFLKKAYRSNRLVVKGRHAPKRFAAVLQFVRFVQVVAVAVAVLFLVGGDRVESLVDPAITKWMQKHGLQAALFLLFVVPQLLQQLTSTGAFEITLIKENGALPVVIWSKLKTGQFPDERQLVQALASAGITRVEARKKATKEPSE